MIKSGGQLKSMCDRAKVQLVKLSGAIIGLKVSVGSRGRKPNVIASHIKQLTSFLFLSMLNAHYQPQKTIRIC